MAEKLKWETKKVKVKDLIELDINPRKISDAKKQKLVESLEKFNLAEIPAVNTDMQIIGGNQRVSALMMVGRGDEEIDVRVPNRKLTKKEVKEYAIISNTHAGEFDFEILELEFADVQIEEIGFDVIGFDDWKKKQDIALASEAKEDDFDVPVGGIETDIVLGDLFEIGEHRLLCGDSTDSDSVAKLMNGEKAEISFTSPPYNAGTTPTEIKMGKTSKYANDSDNKTETEYLKLLIDFTNNTLLFSDYSFVNIQSLSGNKTALIDFLYNMKEYYADTLIWQKQNAQPAMAENVLNSQFEYIHVFSHKANRAIGTKRFRGTLSNVLDISKQNKNGVKEHNATFPIDFAAHFVQNFCENSVLDLFLGSGTTMVASHQLKRKCYGMELDCKYVEVIVTRMIKLDKTLIIKRNGIEETQKWLNKIA